MEVEYESFHSDYVRYISEEAFWALVAENAYLKAESRGFVDGHPIQDWLAAELEVCKQCFYWVQEA